MEFTRRLAEYVLERTAYESLPEPVVARSKEMNWARVSVALISLSMLSLRPIPGSILDCPNLLRRGNVDVCGWVRPSYLAKGSPSGCWERLRL